MLCKKEQNASLPFPIEDIYESLFQQDMSILESKFKLALRFGFKDSDIFEIILCIFIRRLKECPDCLEKISALKNTMQALEYVGAMYKKRKEI